MRQLFIVLCCTLSFWGECQSDVIATEAIDSFSLQPDYAPVTIDGRPVWYDLMNRRASDSVQISAFVQPPNGYNPSFIVKNDSLWGMLNNYGDEELPFLYDSIVRFNNFLFARKGEVWSFREPDVIFYDGPNGVDVMASAALEDVWTPISFDSLYFDGKDLFLFDKGKTGMILEDGTIISPEYDGIQRIQYGFYGAYDMFLTLSGKYYNLLDGKGNEILSKGAWDLRETEDGVFEYLIGDHPEYYVPYLGTFVKPKGRDVIFYGMSGYKIYSEDKSTSELHLTNGEVLKGTFDDYFLFFEDLYAVRQGDKVGLSKDGRNVIGALKYDQINLISNFRYDHEMLFRYYIDDACGLMDQTGRELFEAKYANVLGTGHANRFVVIDNELGGVIDRAGRMVIPMEYDHIYFDEKTELFVVQQKDRIGLFDFNGKQITPIEYTLYNRLESFSKDHLVVLKKDDQFYFVQKEKMLAAEGFHHFNYYEDVLKAYGDDSISIFLFNDKGKLEAREDYPHYKKAVVRSDNYYWKWEALNDWVESELEENQREGYYGLRYYTKRGFGVEPQYRTVIPDGFSNYLAEVDDVPKKDHSISKQIPLELVKGFHYLMTGIGEANTQLIFNSEVSIINNGSNDRYLHHFSDGTHKKVAEGNSGISIDISNNYRYSDENLSSDFNRFNSEYRRYFIADSVELTTIDSADISLHAYVDYWNGISACRFSREMMRTLMNPKLGVRFVIKKVGIINSSIFGIRKDYLSYNAMSYFDEYRYVLSNIFFEKPMDSLVGSLKSNLVGDPRDKIFPISHVMEAEAAEGWFGDYVVAKVESDQIAKIHVDYPDFFFVQDSLNVSYNGGRITRKVDSNSVVLVTPEGKRLTNPSWAIRYLNKGCFGLLTLEGWQIVDKNGKPISDLFFKEIAEFKDDRAELTLENGSAVIINSKGETLEPLPEPRVYVDSDHFHFKSNPSVFYEIQSGLSDEARDAEKYQSGFFQSKNEGKTILRPFGSSETKEVKSDLRLKYFGNQVYYVKGKHLYAMGSDLGISKFKKMDRLKLVTPNIAWLQGKEDVLIDRHWNIIHRIDESDRFELQDGELVIFHNDSTSTNYGSFDPNTAKDIDTEPEPLNEVVMQNGKYGVLLQDSVVLPATYSWLSKINEQEFFTKIGVEQHLYDARLERIGDQSFDHYVQTDMGNFVFYRNGQTFIVSEDRLRCSLLSLD